MNTFNICKIEIYINIWCYNISCLSYKFVMAIFGKTRAYLIAMIYNDKIE